MALKKCVIIRFAFYSLCIDNFLLRCYNAFMDRIINLTPEYGRLTREYAGSCPKHYHEKWEMILFVEGKTLNLVNGTGYECVKGNIFFCGPPHHHEIRHITKPHLHWDLYCTDSEMREICNAFDKNLYSRLLDVKEPMHFSLPSPLFDQIIAKLQRLKLLDSFDYSLQTKQAIANSVFSFILSYYVEKIFIKESAIPAWFYEFIERLQKTEVFSCSVVEIIKDTGYSHTQFSKLFKQYTGITLIEHIMNLRLEYACTKLTTSHDSVLQISSQVGYDSLSFFTKIFKQKFGITPLQYRKNANKDTPPPRN